MNDMSTAYEESGRRDQKRRTRAALVDAARSLVASGELSPTVEQAAKTASVSRTTAYRYFPSQTSLLLAAHPETLITSLLPDGIGDDPVERLAAATEAFTALVVETEPQLRATMRLSLAPDARKTELPLRQGRAVGWFRDALAPLVPDLTDAQATRLAEVIRSAVGIESLVWLTDVAGLDRDEASEVMQWTALALLQRTLDGFPPPVRALGKTRG